MRAKDFINEAEKRDPKTHPMLIKARIAHPNAATDLEALTLYFSELAEKDIKRLDAANRREDQHLEKLDRIDQRIQRDMRDLEKRVDDIERFTTSGSNK
jgi:predicted phage gp36 major capsid-like protein